MRLFSERKGLKKVRTEFQVESVDVPLRNGLWDMLTSYYWEKGYQRMGTEPREDIDLLRRNIWHAYFKTPIDTIPSSWHDSLRIIRKFYFEECPWNEVYDFIEFVATAYPEEPVNQEFTRACNVILERELSAYRFVGKQIAQVTSKEEIGEIEQALETPLKTVDAHLQNAVKLMSDRKAPDYRNSIKESISAVEAICRTIAENDKATLGQALDAIEKKGKIELHKALKRAFDSLYGYTSSTEGIRHALLDETTLSFEDAKFMLVSCSAFVNYLVSKAAKAGLKIE